jgi:LemA protein
MYILIAFLALLVLLFVFILLVVSVYNGIIALKIAVQNAWSNVSVQLKRRLDLIPNLVETVKGYAKHEQETLEKVIAARNASLSAKNPAEQIDSANQLQGMLRQVFALVESYPDLKANQNFLELQNELINTEDSIAGTRDVYNRNVQYYNTKIMQVPGNLIAGFMGFTPEPFYELSSEEKSAAEASPKISF